MTLVGTSTSLAVIIEGESLLNDGVSIVMFLILKDLAANVKLSGIQKYTQIHKSTQFEYYIHF